MNTKILIMGLPGSGKTTLAEALQNIFQQCSNIHCKWYNADAVRREYNDWDFSEEGRLRQANRMKELCSGPDLYIADFVAPTEEIRKHFDADLVIWMDTIKEGRFEDTNKVFVKPKADLVISDFNYDIKKIVKRILQLDYFGIQDSLNILNIVEPI